MTRARARCTARTPAGPEGCTTVEVFGSLEGVFRVINETQDGAPEFDFRTGKLPEDYQPLAWARPAEGCHGVTSGAWPPES